MRSAETERATVKVMIATPLEEELVRKIEGTDARLEVLYDRTLLPPPRYPSDHKGEPSFRRDAAGERRWEEMLESAEVLFGIPGDSPEMLREVVRRAPRVEWIQATSAGAGEQVRVAGLPPEELDRVIVHVPRPTVDLDRSVEDVHDHVGGHHLDHRDLAARRLLALGIHLPGGVEGEQSRLLGLDPRFGDEVLDELLVGER